jgi:prefoldin subunit 5
MRHDSKALEKKSGFLLLLSETAKELSEEISSLADKVESIEFLKEHIQNAINDEGGCNPDDITFLEGELAKKKADLEKKKSAIELLEARLRNFKSDASRLGVELL